MISGEQYAKYFSILLLTFIALALRAAGNKLNNKMLKYFCILPLKSLNICYLFYVDTKPSFANSNRRSLAKPCS